MQAPSGLEHVTNERLARLISYIHHTCEFKQYCHVGTQHDNADWDCFRTLILPEILKTQNQHQGRDSCAYSEVIRSCQHFGCARNKLQFHTVRRTLKLFLLMQDYAWMEYQLLIFGICLLKCFILPITNQRNQRSSAGRLVA